ncbi:MAG TPA: cardiolipin synthase ClsB [Burkholderiaceae bacterium]|jgi:cardiolipin synthase|nr:cardiolipin synthase ClsB [Burkholderiaceae bacterium]
MRSVTFTANNHITLLHCGAEFFPALVAAFDAATVEIYLETYIFADDKTGERIKAALQRAACRGVNVNVITDWIGTGRVRSNLLGEAFLAAGVNHRSFNPWFGRGMARTHRKMCVVDRKLAFLGGLNINDDLLSDDSSSMVLPAPRWDFAVGIEGPLVAAIHREIEAQWARLGSMNLKMRWEKFKEIRATHIAASNEPALAALVVRDNLRNRHTIQRAYLHALGHARKSARLANPYFAPGRKLRDALASAAARGVDVTLLLGVGQFKLQDAVAHSFYPKLLKSGVKVVEYQKTQLHGKVAVVDDEWATVGSSNYDGFSLFVNQEANIVIKDARFAQQLRAHIERGVADGKTIKLDDFAHIPWYKRAWYGAAYLLYKGILRIITLGRYTE